MNRVVVATCLAVMLGLASHPAAQSPAGPTDVHMIELAVKGSKRVPESWAYYAFGGPMMGGYGSTAAPQPKASCFNCHSEHAARDNGFMQFYGLLNEAGPKK